MREQVNKHIQKKNQEDYQPRPNRIDFSQNLNDNLDQPRGSENF